MFCTCFDRLHSIAAIAALASGMALSSAQGDTTIPIQGIGTSLSGEYTINTHVENVTCSGQFDVVIAGIPVREIRGTISGIGWGGGGIVARARNAHYRYRLPFVARWRRDCQCPRLVFFAHGGGVALINAIKREKAVGSNNQNRIAERNGDLLAGVPALLDNAAYISINRRGLRGDGTFSATYLAEVPPLTATEVTALEAELAASPGGSGFQQTGLTAGAPVPLVPTNDATTCRDVARALEVVVAGFVGRPFRTRIGVGTSSGARLLAALNCGRSVTSTASLRTGGNHVIPYNACSPRIFDGYILNGFTYIPDVEHVDPSQPLSAPTVLIQGQGDERYQQHVTLAHELLQKGVTLQGSVWIYEVQNLVHITRDIVAETTQPTGGDRLACFFSAAIRNLRSGIEERRPLPCSRLAGRIVDGALRFEQSGGSTTNVAPIVNDPATDSFIVDSNLTPRTIGPAETTRWLAVTAALAPVADAIAPPSVACRLGGYRLMFFGNQLVPMSSSDLRAKYGSFENYRQCVCRTVAILESQCLYDSRVESASATAEFARGLFE